MAMFYEVLCFFFPVAIRQYEEKQLRSQQERARKRLQFSNQISRLQSQLDYERKRNTRTTVRKLAESISADESSIAALKEEEKALLKVTRLTV